MGGEADLLRRGKSKHGCNVSSLLGFEETLEWTSCGMREREREREAKEDFALLSLSENMKRGWS